jgi:KUP system potassium uptake protein
VYEGGTFALYSVLRQHLNFKSEMVMPLNSLDSDANLKFHSTRSSMQSKARKFIEESTAAQKIITYVVLLGTCMVIGDGALTPAISGIVCLVNYIYIWTCFKSFAFLRFFLQYGRQ